MTSWRVYYQPKLTNSQRDYLVAFSYMGLKYVNVGDTSYIVCHTESRLEAESLADCLNTIGVDVICVQAE